MGLLSTLLQRAFGGVGSDGKSMRERPQGLAPIEKLEARLCLGSMHAASLADWSEDSLDQTEPAIARTVLDDRLDGDASEIDGRPTDSANAPPLDGLLNHGSYSASQPASRIAFPQEASSSDNSAPNRGPFNIALQTTAALASELGQSELGQSELGQSVLARTAASARNSTDGNALADAGTEPAASESAASDVRATGKFAAGSGAIDGYSNAAASDGGAANSPSFSGSAMQSQPQQTPSSQVWNAQLLRQLGLTLDQHGNAWGRAEGAASHAGRAAWWNSAEKPVVIGFDFRDQNGVENVISEEQKTLAVQSLERWADAANGKIVFQQDTEADVSRIINIGVGDVGVFGHVSGEGGLLGLSGGRVSLEDGQLVARGVAWLDHAEQWDNVVNNGNPEGTIDFSTVVSHELGHALGYGDTATRDDGDIMDGAYRGERSLDAIAYSATNGYFYRGVDASGELQTGYDVLPMVVAMAQLEDSEVQQLLERASRATSSNDAIIAVVDRNGRVLGVRVESDVLTTITDVDTLVFAIDGAIAKARTAALFSNGNPNVGTLAPLTSRTVRFLSQTTITEREVDSNPNVDGASAAIAAASTVRGPGFVAPIGAGGHFPPEIKFTPPVDLFGIEHTNRDSTTHPGADGIRGTADDFELRARFNIDPAHVPVGSELSAPESYGHVQNSGLLPNAQSRGIATLPGGIPLFRDTSGDGVGETLVGGIGVFFPGANGTAIFEQNFEAFTDQSSVDHTNADKVLEAEYIAFAAAGGSLLAEQQFGVAGAKFGAIGGVAAVPGLDVPFGRLDLVGIQLQVIGPIAGKNGLRMVLEHGRALGEGGDSGADQPLIGGTLGLYRDGEIAPGDDTAGGVFLVNPHSSADMTAAEVSQIITQGILAASEVRAAVRLPLGSRTKMVFAITDTKGEVLGLYRMQDATTFSIDVAVAKARNVAYYADSTILQPEDKVPGVAAGTAFTNRTFRFLAEPRFPSGIDGIIPDFSILNDGDVVKTGADIGENISTPDRVDAFTSVMGHDAFFPMTNFRDPGDSGVVADGGVPQDLANQNGIVFFPGSTPLYRNGVLIGGLGVSGDGVDQDDVVTSVAATGFQAAGNATRADETMRLGVRLPFQKFLRNPWG